MRWPNDLEQTICYFTGGTFSSSIQDSPFISRVVRSNTSLKFFRIMFVLQLASSRDGIDIHRLQTLSYPFPDAPYLADINQRQ